MASFQHRLDEQIELETHDIGFLYILTAIADYQVNGHEAFGE
jgi:unsaturated chondroitin disaccharide hydrolase